MDVVCGSASDGSQCSSRGLHSVAHTQDTDAAGQSFTDSPAQLLLESLHESTDEYVTVLGPWSSPMDGCRVVVRTVILRVDVSNDVLTYDRSSR